MTLFPAPAGMNVELLQTISFRKVLTNTSAPQDFQIAVRIQPEDELFSLEEPDPCPRRRLGQKIQMNVSKVFDKAQSRSEVDLAFGISGVVLLDVDVASREDEVSVVCCHSVGLQDGGGRTNGQGTNFKGSMADCIVICITLYLEGMRQAAASP